MVVVRHAPVCESAVSRAVNVPAPVIGRDGGTRTSTEGGCPASASTCETLIQWNQAPVATGVVGRASLNARLSQPPESGVARTDCVPSSLHASKYVDGEHETDVVLVQSTGPPLLKITSPRRRTRRIVPKN